ncbi:Nuclear transport factor 2 family protein with RNA binding domain [Hibiscus syriacus]|uniref:Nuclear transport factor 2 family protein with RNA binding domain n=1 Tax=Hibiscus syriacus TaxID=106335 RepID=A0A6A2ZKY6_HIBSY|nr:Nuclear transport factor 2 family protein with RNA binding domain [Hibiscus syriacus]
MYRIAILKRSDRDFETIRTRSYRVLDRNVQYVDRGQMSDLCNYAADLSPALENHIGHSTALPEGNGPEVYNSFENGDGSIEEEAPVAKVVDEFPGDLHMVSDSKPKTDELPKKSYASIVRVLKENAVPSPVPAHSPVLSAVKSHECPGIAVPPTAPAPASDAQISSNNVTENGNNHDAEAEGPSIYVKGLPLKATPSMLEIEFKKFGPIKSDGIQVRSQKGFCFGFVEFEMASSVQSAIEFGDETGMSKVVENINGLWIDGRKVFVGVAKYQKDRPRAAGTSRSQFDAAEKFTEEKSKPCEKAEFQRSIRDDRSYKDALLTSSTRRRDLEQQENKYDSLDRRRGKKNIWEMHIPTKSSSWVKRLLMGIVKQSFDLELVQRALANEGFEVQIASWGYVWNSCVVMFKSEEKMKEAWLNKSEELWFWFDRLAPLLNEGGVPMAYCLVELYGVPLLCWQEDFLEKLAGRWGTMEGIQESTKTREDLTTLKILLRVASLSDVPEVNIRVKDSNERVTVMELEEEEDDSLQSSDKSGPFRLVEEARQKVDTWIDQGLSSGFAGVGEVSKGLESQHDLIAEVGLKDPARNEDAVGSIEGVKVISSRGGSKNRSATSLSLKSDPVGRKGELRNRMGRALIPTVCHSEIPDAVVTTEGDSDGSRDFNAYLTEDEKEGRAQNNNSMEMFRLFIQQTRLIDLPLIGGNFTWSSNRVYPTVVRLDRRRMNSINALNLKSEIIKDSVIFKTSVRDHFFEAFNCRSTLEVEDIKLNFSRISLEQSLMLEKKFTEEEIWETLNSCDSNKAPGPDGLNMRFFKRFWPSLKGSNIGGLDDFKPISLVGGMYKILSKCLARRLRCCINDIISDSQFPFIPGRQILDFSFIANEGIDLWRKKGLKGCVFKVDFKKAYDTIDWDLLFKVMVKMGFKIKWCSWIQKCVATASVSVLVNGVPTEEFSMAIGLRQGCFLSLLLFNLVGEFLNLLLLKAVSSGLFCGLGLGKDEILNVKRVLRVFEVMSGLKLNLIKSKLFGINITEEELMQWASTIGCSVGHFPSKYLGLPLGAKRNTLVLWDPIVQKFYKKLVGWKAKTLSMAGRLVLLKAVLCSLLCTDKSVSGLGVLNLSYMNRALLGKWSWRFVNDRETLWKKMICNKYILDPRLLLFKSKLPAHASWIWKSVVNNHFKEDQFGAKFQSLFKVRVGNGVSIRFWFESWALDSPLKIVFPRLFVLSLNKNVKLNEFDGLVWRGNGEGIYSVKSSVKSCCPVSTAESFWMKNIWRGLVPPRVEIFMWQGNAQSFILAWEDMVPYSSIWSFIPGVVLWTIWKYRNVIVFEGGRSDQIDLFFMARFRLATWFLAKFKDVSISKDSLISDPFLGDRCSPSRNLIIKIVSWSPPPKGFIKLNVDAAVSGDWRKSGVGGLLRVEAGSVMGSFQEVAGLGSPLLIELKAIKKGLIFFDSIQQRFKERLIVENDSKLAVDWVKNYDCCPFVYIDLVKDIVAKLRDLESVIRWVARLHLLTLVDVKPSLKKSGLPLEARNKWRSSSVSGSGYRNEGARGRGNYGGGGRGYSWGEFGNRSSNRGYSNRGDGYQRGELMGGNGGRVNRSGEPAFNAAAKNEAPRVSAPA